MSNKALSLHIQNQQFFSAHNTQKKKSKEKNFHRGFCAHKKREKGPRGFGSFGSVVSLSRCFLRRPFAREQTPNHHQRETRRSWLRLSKFSIRTRKATNAFESCSKILNRVYGRYERRKGTTTLTVTTTTETRTW